MPVTPHPTVGRRVRVEDASSNRACGIPPAMAVCGAVEYLAVAQMPRRWSRKLQGTLLRGRYRLPRAWHAVPAHGESVAALCGFRYTREPHRTWKQTMIPRRCPKCQRLVDESESLARDPATNRLWAVPTQDAAPYDAASELGAVELVTPTSDADPAAQGVVPAT